MNIGDRVTIETVAQDGTVEGRSFGTIVAREPGEVQGDWDPFDSSGDDWIVYQDPPGNSGQFEPEDYPTNESVNSYRLPVGNQETRNGARIIPGESGSERSVPASKFSF